jgi:large subunit ribosomal protein L3
MTQIFDDAGIAVPVTVVQAGPCHVTQIKTEKTDGYDAVQIAFGDIKVKRVKSPLKGHFSKAGVGPKRYLREFDFADMEEVKVGDEIKADIFAEGSTVRVSGISKGKGFQGTIKRHNFSRGPKTHGQSDRLRAPGSLGQGSSPSRVFRGHKMAGRMGSDRITLKRVQVVRVDADNNLIFLKGAIPGAANTLLEIVK